MSPPGTDRFSIRLARKAADRARRSLGFEEIKNRLEEAERRLDVLSSHTAGPAYLGEHTALVKTQWGANMVVDTRDQLVAPHLLLDGIWEPHITKWMTAAVKPGDIFFDVGANVGYYSLLAGRIVGPSGKVVAVEAHPNTARLLRRNVVLNGLIGVVTVWERAAWSSSTNLTFKQRDNYAANSSVGSLEDSELQKLDDSETEIKVEAVRVDDLLVDIDRVDVMKIDVEGSEVQAVRGMERLLAASPDIKVMFEWSPGQIEMVGDEPRALLDALEGHGLSFFLIEDGLARYGPDRLLDVHYGNVVATRRLV